MKLEEVKIWSQENISKDLLSEDLFKFIDSLSKIIDSKIYEVFEFQRSRYEYFYDIKPWLFNDALNIIFQWKIQEKEFGVENIGQTSITINLKTLKINIKGILQIDSEITYLTPYDFIEFKGIISLLTKKIRKLSDNVIEGIISEKKEVISSNKIDANPISSPVNNSPIVQNRNSLEVNQIPQEQIMMKSPNIPNLVGNPSIKRMIDNPLSPLRKTMDNNFVKKKDEQQLQNNKPIQIAKPPEKIEGNQDQKQDTSKKSVPTKIPTSIKNTKNLGQEKVDSVNNLPNIPKPPSMNPLSLKIRRVLNPKKDDQ